MKDNKKHLIIADLIPLIAIAVCIAVAVIIGGSIDKHYNDAACDFESGWVTETGETLSLGDVPKGDLVLTHTLEGVNIKDKRLCMTSADTYITAEFDGECTYTYAPELPPLLGRSYGRYVHMIPIPPDAKTVTLHLHPVYEFNAVYVKRVAIQDAAMFIGDIYHNGLPGFALCLLIALFGVLMLIIGITQLGVGNAHAMSFFSLGTFAILVGMWSANDTMILQVFTQRPEMIRLINFLCIIFLSYPPVSFVANATGMKNTVLLPIMQILVAVNFGVTMLLASTGISDVRNMLTFSHINIMVALIMVIVLFVRAVRRKTIDKQFGRTLLIGMGSMAVGVLFDLLRFAIEPNNLLGSSFCTRAGMLIFIVMLGLHLMRERNRLAVEQSRAEIMSKMAYTDGLTGLPNRAAFQKHENEILGSGGSCCIVQLDINFLKKVNDVYGHAEGDKHIISAAHIIRDSFADIGTAYRTGGDEFIVITAGGRPAEIDKALSDLEEAEKAYNDREKPPVPLMIAYGSAEFTSERSSLAEAEKLADDRMYEMKKVMKAAHGGRVRPVIQKTTGQTKTHLSRFCIYNTAPRQCGPVRGAPYSRRAVLYSLTNIGVLFTSFCERLQLLQPLYRIRM